MRTGRPLLAAAALAVATTTAAYLFGPGAGESPAASKKKTTTAESTTESTTAAEGAADSAAAAACKPDARYPKRQLRGVWIATTTNLDWPAKPGLSQAQQQAQYVKILDAAVKRRLNAVFVQVRPASDAIYKSSLEPWSKFLTGTAGKDPGWDPLPFLIGEAHKRGLEFHAWFNPYRAAYESDVSQLPAGHPARQHPGWVVKYGGRLYYNPGLPQVREHVVKVVDDVVSRYDVDGVHFDDYFYPYPGEGGQFNDKAAFAKYGKGQSLAEWRRGNVNKLVAEVDKSVHARKSYVKFGISPFGIWRNKAQDPAGSDTSGMSAYDSIYADARAWIKAGTVDYIMPQLYWPRGFAAADYRELMPWWAGAVKGTGVHLYIGQALYRVGADQSWSKAGELAGHLSLNRKYPEVKGDVYFSAKNLLANPLGAMDRVVKEFYSRPALLPLMKDRGGQAPAKPAGVRANGRTLSWTAAQGARAYAVYQVPQSGDDCHATDARSLVAVVTSPSYQAKAAGTYLVTSLDRLTHESKPARVKVS
ncbi:family 10 glycosylhydrolase [Actinomadura sp. ATCC 31491]|uniref:Family 10 glycosylhydrolase n=1 Tax=Actinomadura luzonensis TaxID=2805427 RepID=A0ABT0FWL0_9ACTN|nr:family 10 glycosylhydrolase [Actinomadura luzonensis]MCK2216729.1 family 10 glycosylhydrolase [Actinomadura luzonensis]